MDSAPAPKQVVGIAGSAGGLPALSTILAHLPASFPCPVLVMLHVEANHPSLLTEVLARCTPLQVVKAVEGMALQSGFVYVAPPDHHLTVSTERRVHLTREPRVHWVRPSADVLFQSLADVFGAAAVGVLCSGTGKDGASGLRALHERGGLTLVQDRATSLHFGMPGEAIRLKAVDAVLPLDQLASRLVEAVSGRSGTGTPGKTETS